ncbi:ubiquitin carboxyl-terminal hydrolase [Actinomortierella wolfii]|nr:ubiquitin carboxyl-terminal hydrolase [Actinomortierella wolfii]KAG0241180.1 ubiquitin carboxyl-terminal hydrolase [Actinomortierella wolfii]
MTDAGNWCLIESDPGVFTGLIKGIGVKGVQVEEIYSLDKETLHDLKPVHGLIFLFKFEGRAPSGAESSEAPIDYTNQNVFFAQQVINNACATQAILSILLNSKNIDLGEELSNFKSFVADFPPDLRGHAISNSDVIRTVHNSFARSDPFINDMHDPTAKEKEDLFHFISYLPIDGQLYELDGLQEGPKNHGPVPEGEDGWLDKVGPIIQQRMSSYTGGEIRFNLMAVVDDRIKVYQEKLRDYEQRLASLVSKEGPDAGAWLQGEIDHIQKEIQREQDKRAKQERENKLRRHNFVPLIYEILKGLAKDGKLNGLVEEGRERAKREEELAKQRKAAAAAAGKPIDEDEDMY